MEMTEEMAKVIEDLAAILYETEKKKIEITNHELGQKVRIDSLDKDCGLIDVLYLLLCKHIEIESKESNVSLSTPQYKELNQRNI